MKKPRTQAPPEVAMPFVEFQEKVLKVKRTLPQRVLFRVGIDHVDPIDLPPEEREIAAELFGPVERIPPAARGTFFLSKGARVGGTLGCSEVLLWSALTCRLDGLAAGEQAYAIAVCPDLRLGKQARNYALGAAKGVPQIAQLILSESAEGFTLCRPDGKTVCIENLPATRGGSALRGRTLVACLLDEASFFRDAESGVVNDLELYRAVAPRVLPDGRLMVCSTAWMRSGLLYSTVEANHGDPKTCIAAIAPTLKLRPNDGKLAGVVAEERARDALNAAREFDCVPFDNAGSTFIDSAAIDAMVDDALHAGAFA